MTRQERVTLAAYCGISDVTDTGGAVVLAAPEVPSSPMLNRVVGLGLDTPATEEALDAALAVLAPGTTFYVAVSPRAEPEQLPDWLHDRGLEPGWGWMMFARSADVPGNPASSLSLVEVESEAERAAFARIVREGYGLPETIDARLRHVPEAGWQCLVALDGDEPAGAAALFVSEDAGYLGFAATLPEHRGKGAQTVLLRERIRRAAAAGCDLLLTETGERRDDLPSNSYRNILRAGFAEVAVTANWVGTGT
jgi:GNAT superfamily N-acetyltransferase